MKRVRWVTLGIVIGCGGTLWVQHKARVLTERFLPEGLADRAELRARAVRGDLRDALAEGRDAMHARERELRSRFERGELESQPAPDGSVAASPGPTRHRGREHPSVAHDHPSVNAPHLHLVNDGQLTAEDQAHQR